MSERRVTGKLTPCSFYRDTLGFEVRSDVGQGKMRWITVGPAGQPSTSILLAPPAADPRATGAAAECRAIGITPAEGARWCGRGRGWEILAVDENL